MTTENGGRLTIPESQDPLERALLDIIGHLGAALNQRVPGDDRIIMRRIEEAYDVAIEASRQHRERQWAKRRREILDEITTKGI